ncbi:MAG TPA: RNA methyltransferase [Polyangiaceae bacterium]|nr:RNA methyltransferase [Polyangiaceae bacterium]
MTRFAIALIHHPVLDREGGIVTTAMTNLDLHDMARSARTFGAAGLYIVHPIEAQRELAGRIVSHWVTGSGRRRIPDRAGALEIVRIVPALDDAVRDLGGEGEVEIWTTAARARGEVTTWLDAPARFAKTNRTVLVLFGTGWGLAPELIERAAVRLAPIHGAEIDGYNHLSVRAACAITLDRLASADHAAPRDR